MLAILTNYNAMEVQKNRQGLCIMIMIICNYNSIRSEQAQRDLLLLLKYFSSSKPHASFASTPYLYSKQYDFLL
jgi:hypothetical protein